MHAPSGRDALRRFRLCSAWASASPWRTSFRDNRGLACSPPVDRDDGPGSVDLLREAALVRFVPVPGHGFCGSHRGQERSPPSVVQSAGCRSKCGATGRSKVSRAAMSVLRPGRHSPGPMATKSQISVACDSTYEDVRLVVPEGSLGPTPSRPSGTPSPGLFPACTGKSILPSASTMSSPPSSPTGFGCSQGRETPDRSLRQRP